MSTVAEHLKHAREARRLSIEDVAEITKIRTDHLRALESGDYDVFSAPVYIRGFVRCCAMALKLDVPEVMATLDAELGRTTKFAEHPPLTERSRGVLDFIALQLSKINWAKAAIGLGILIVVGGIIAGAVAWRHYRTRDPLKGLKPATYKASPQKSGETLPLPKPKK
jgi:cytoskeletal protein RodZ